MSRQLESDNTSWRSVTRFMSILSKSHWSRVSWDHSETSWRFWTLHFAEFVLLGEKSDALLSDICASFAWMFTTFSHLFAGNLDRSRALQCTRFSIICCIELVSRTNLFQIRTDWAFDHIPCSSTGMFGCHVFAVPPLQCHILSQIALNIVVMVGLVWTYIFVRN